LSEGLLVSPGGAGWLRRRRIVQSLFNRDNLSIWMEVAERSLSETMGRWRGYASAGSVVDLSAEMDRLAMTVACRSLLDLDLDIEGEAGQLSEDLRVVADSTAQFLVRPFPPLAVPTRRNREFRRSMRRIQDFADRVVASQSGPVKGRTAITAEFVDAADGLLSSAQIRDELVGLFFAGHRSLADSLTWCWSLLADNDNVRDRIHRELSTVLGDRTPTPADLHLLNYTHMAMMEAMRLYPVAWIMMRRAIGPDEIAGKRIPAGALITWSPFVGNRHPDVWERPNDFWPDRFTEQRRGSFAPFGLGPRACVAGDLATAEACLILATLAQRFDAVPVSSVALVPEPSMTLRVRGGLPSRLVSRDSNSCRWPGAASAELP
jgi:cytochrome P450